MTVIRVALLTVSDRASAGTYEDLTGPATAAVLRGTTDCEIVTTEVISDEEPQISSLLATWCDDGKVDLIVTNGGTGIALRDRTPEATKAVIDRELPGLAEAMRAAGRTNTALADLSRQVVGHRGPTLIINLPGSPKGAVESLTAIVAVIPHAVELLRG